MKINPLITSSIEKTLQKTAEKGIDGDKESFSKWLQDSLSQVNSMQQEADTSARSLVAGESKDVHGTMIAMEKASIAFNLVMQVRNKVVMAYEEIQRMQF